MGSIFDPYLNLNSFYILFRVSGRKQSENVLDWKIPVLDRVKGGLYSHLSLKIPITHHTDLSPDLC